ncbi:ABC-three component system protein [Blastococcus sp. SYSU DS0619]
MAADKHTAAGQALGYVYQVGWALLELARPGPEDAELRLENIDDVSWSDAAGNPLQALQIKHHLGDGGSLGDRSSDLWRTIQVWLDNPVLRAPDGPALVIVTTQTVPESGALARLGPQDRDPTAAVEALNAAASHSANKSTATARAAWLEQSSMIRSGIVARMTVVWRQATAAELAGQVREALGVGLPVGREDPFVESLLGWWWRVSVDLLAGVRTGVTRLHLRLQLDGLREQYSSRSLPVTVGSDGLPDTTEGHRGRVFAQQLSWVEAGEELLLLAVRDYYRAYSQAQDWVENSMVELAELTAYEHRVVDEWKMQFALVRHSLGPTPSEQELKAAGMRLYAVAMNQPASMLRPGFTEPFFARGTHHSLADRGAVGWHPEFAQRLNALLSGRLP